MKRFFLLVLCAFGFVLAQPNEQVVESNSTTTNFSPDTATSITSKEGTFIKVSSGQASALTQEEAVRLAIIDAVMKLKGFNTANFKQQIRTQSFSNFNLFQPQVFTSSTFKATKGYIDSYELTKVALEPNGRYFVSVNVFKTLFSRNEKPNLVIFNASRFKALGENLGQKLVNDFTKSKKFNVLDRKNEAYYKAEKAVIESEDGSSEDIFKLGNVMGSDYMLIFNLRDISASSSKSSKLTTQSNTLKGDVAVDYRLILFATKEIKLANTITLQLSLKDESVKTNEEALTKIANALSKDILNELYPAYITLANEGEVSFEEELELNAVYECINKSQGTSSKVQITSVNKNSSKGKVLQGIAGFNDTCTLSSEQGREATYKLGTNGGVNLGF
ncbi:CsgG/HfaB family protein [Campylobacter sp. MIT 97-5078]|uniref:CsgG/HfaB family protein n=1 Tax=Campylobacter sp. MIT 97-5078 TaxID=1548153 RepID=UPI000512EE69|nr:CsgG/HfaB family protein [Campylobacter sp. MIT 97-5078]KGI56312.1 hypothetical protein LR59_07755 [Campylobacter sp. MIT 97-5078]KGI57559.1 hypothetical protein LR59_02385 [Campylobacter sp. MIT 97-5078]KGI57744.1 hypothetical protein LR59_03430 [Campylobacter sp. MIT 97-5078]TQR26917.1 hypothetical protein DMB91_05935 [Campylobacter sp. MIT 97-5078]